MTKRALVFDLEGAGHPVLDCGQAARWEAAVLIDAEAEWGAMRRAGVALAGALRRDWSMSRWRQSGLSALALVGKGHNGGDALLALAALAEETPGWMGAVSVALGAEMEALRPNTRRALEELRRVAAVRVFGLGELEAALDGGRFDVCLDGLFGMSFRPPMREREAAALALVNGSSGIRWRVAVDLPSGLHDGWGEGEICFRADASYATGILKAALLRHPARAGAARYLDLGFFDGRAAERRSETADTFALTDAVLDPLRGLRAARSDKRSFGHLAIVAGSRQMPGALLMSVQAALRSGLGLLTVFAPESVVAQLAPAAPEAMWRSWPETLEGGLALEGLCLIRAFKSKASALLLGPGMGKERETQALLYEIVSDWDKPIVLDADALRPELVARLGELGNDRCVLLPHEGEFLRLSGSDDLSDEAARGYARQVDVVLVKKGAATRVTDGERVFVCPVGNAVLARGGSGDLLAGLAAGLLAQFPDEPLAVGCAAAYWHGKAADLMAMDLGQTAVCTSELLRYLSGALMDGGLWNPDSLAAKRSGL